LDTVTSATTFQNQLSKTKNKKKENEWTRKHVLVRKLHGVALAYRTIVQVAKQLIHCDQVSIVEKTDRVGQKGIIMLNNYRALG
jgi:hypothetical protein